MPERRDLLTIAGLGAASVLIVLPYLLAGPGFFMDDWRNLARLDTVGWMRAAEASRFASRPVSHNTGGYHLVVNRSELVNQELIEHLLVFNSLFNIIIW